MLVRLTVKLAEVVNGVDLSRYREGDVIELSVRDAEMLIAEGWAERVAEGAASPRVWHPIDRAIAADGKRNRRSR
ncbi:MAG TPA: hypothetical protein VMO26_18625 [Vicinamibacterales bacterium]|nr:hypothetical protein [Vicinamibacterales bacterium]